MKSIRILPQPHGSRLLGEDIHTATHFDTPLEPLDLKALIEAAARTPDENPRVELAGVLADRTSEGVRVHVVAKTAWFDIPWPMVARGIALK